MPCILEYMELDVSSPSMRKCSSRHEILELFAEMVRWQKEVLLNKKHTKRATLIAKLTRNFDFPWFQRLQLLVLCERVATKNVKPGVPQPEHRG